MLFYNMLEELYRAFYNLGRYLHRLGVLDWIKVRIERIKKLR